MKSFAYVARVLPNPTLRRLKSLHDAWIAIRWRIQKRTDYAIDVTLDALLGIKTFVRVPVAPDMSARNIEYDPLPYRSLRAVARHLPLLPSDHLLDIGCGKGRVLCFFARRRVRRCSGIEIVQDLCEDARRNARSLRGRRAPIDVTHADAIDAEIGDASIIYLFNPFSAEVMQPVLRHIEHSFRVRPRALRICYVNPVHGALLDARDWLTCADRFVVTWNGWHTCPVNIWTAHSEPAHNAHTLKPARASAESAPAQGLVTNGCIEPLQLALTRR